MVATVARIMLIAALLLLEGCVLPSFSGEPYPQELLQQIRPGESSREHVRTVLGEPHASRDGDRYWLYGRTRTAAYLIVQGGGPLVEANWVLVEFGAGDVAARVEHVEEGRGCTTDGLCLLDGFMSCDPQARDGIWGKCVQQSLRDQFVILTAPAQMTEKARAYRAGPDHCALYFSMKPVAVVGRPVWLTIDGVPRTPVNGRSFDWSIVSPGEHALGVSGGGSWDHATLARTCRGGESIYLRYVQSYSRGNATLQEIDEAEFREITMDGALVLPREAVAASAR